MSRAFLVTVIGCLTAFGAFMLILHHREIALIDALLLERATRQPCASVPYEVGSRPACVTVGLEVAT